MTPDTPSSSQTVPGRRRSHLWSGPILLAAVLYAAILAYPLLAPIVLSYLLTLVLSLALNPVVGGLQRRCGSRALAITILVVLFLTVLGMTGRALYGSGKQSSAALFGQLTKYSERAQPPREPHPDAAAPPAVANDGGSARHILENATQATLASVITSLNQLVLHATALVVVGITVFFGVVFTLANPRPIFGALFALVPQQHHAVTARILHRTAQFMPRWAMTTLLAMLTVGFLVGLATWPLFGFADALLLGLIAALLEAIPYIGPILSGVPALLLGLSAGGWTPLWVVLIYIVIQELENNVIAPLLVADRLQLHAVGVIFSMLLAVVAFGVLGVMLAVPLARVTQILHEELFRPRFLPDRTNADLDRLVDGALNVDH